MSTHTVVLSLTPVPGTCTPLADDMVAHGAKTVTLSFVANDSDYIVATGGAAGSKLAGVHDWSYDRDLDCPLGPRRRATRSGMS